jgi:hypothetical protein
LERVTSSKAVNTITGNARLNRRQRTQELQTGIRIIVTLKIRIVQIKDSQPKWISRFVMLS